MSGDEVHPATQPISHEGLTGDSDELSERRFGAVLVFVRYDAEVGVHVLGFTPKHRREHRRFRIENRTTTVDRGFGVLRARAAADVAGTDVGGSSRSST